jgi:signal transduction histidine kinase
MSRGRFGVGIFFGSRADIAVAAALFLLALATLHMSPQGDDAWSVGGVALTVAMSCLLPLARLRPMAALGLMIGALLIAQARYGLVPVFGLMLIAAVFIVASADATSRRLTVGAAVLVAVSIDAGSQLARRDSWSDSAYLVMATTALGAAAAGDAVRSRRAYGREVEERARQAEQAQELAFQRRLAEDRLSIARDVHDLVAHHLAVINVQAEVANHLAEARPAAARHALTQVRVVAQSALGELSSLVGVLRRGGDGSQPPITPSPTLAQLPELMASFEATGLKVTRSQDGAWRPIPPALDLAAYRIVQESLTNAHKHGTGEADLRIIYGADQIVIDILNATPGTPAMDTVAGGYGLSGMRERVAAVGGTLRLEYIDPEWFHVQAALPLPGSTFEPA